MTLNIHTLKLDIQYLQDGLGLTDQQRDDVEAQLALFIKESFARLTLSKLPHTLEQAEKKGASNIALQNMVINLPIIDAHEFLSARAHYFKQFIAPNLERAIYDAMELSANKGFNVHRLTDHTELNIINVDSDWWNNLKTLLQYNTGPLLYAHSFNAFEQQAKAILPRILSNLKHTQIRNFFQLQLCQPHIYNHVYKWLIQKNDYIRLLKGIFNHDVSTQEYDHSGVITYLQQISLTNTQRKRILKDYLELNIATQSQSKDRGQTILDVYIKMHQILSSLNTKNADQLLLLNNIHQSLLMSQSEIWLKHINNWLAVVMHQGIKERDIEALHNLLKRTKGSVWLKSANSNLAITHQDLTSIKVHSQIKSKQAEPKQEEPSQVTSMQPASIQPPSEYPEKQDIVLPSCQRHLRQLYQKALSLLSPLHHFVGDIHALNWQLANIKFFLQGAGNDLNKALVIQLKTALQPLYENQIAKENDQLYSNQYLKTRIDQLLTELAILLQLDQDRLLLRPNQRVDFLLDTLNDLILNPWLPLSLKRIFDEMVAVLTGTEARTVDGILLSSVSIKELKYLQERVTRLFNQWIVQTTSTSTSQYQNVFVSPSNAKISKENYQKQAPKNTGNKWQNRQDLLTDLVNIFTLQGEPSHNDAKASHISQMAEQTLALKVLAILEFYSGESRSKQYIANFLSSPSQTSARVLKQVLEATKFSELETENHIAMLNIKNAEDINGITNKDEIVGIDDVFKYEKETLHKIQQILMTLLTQLVSDKFLSGPNHSNPGSLNNWLMNTVLNKQQIYELLNQIIICLQACQVSSITKKIKKSVDALISIKNHLNLIDAGLAQSSETWWLPLANMFDKSTVTNNQASSDLKQQGQDGEYTTQYDSPKTNTEIKLSRIQTEKALLSHLKACEASIFKQDKIETVISLILEMCAHLEQVGIINVFYEENPDFNKQEIIKNKSTNEDTEEDTKTQKKLDKYKYPIQTELKESLTLWSKTCLKYLKEIPKDKKNKLPIDDKKILDYLTIFMNQCMQLANNAAWPISQLKSCQAALALLVGKLETRPAKAVSLPDVHDLIWSQNLLDTQTLLKQQPSYFLAAKKSEVLLNNHMQKLQSSIPAQAINDLCTELKNDLHELNSIQNQADNIISLDAGLVVIWPYLKDFFNNNQLIHNHKDDEWEFIDDAAKATAHALLVTLLGFKQDDNIWTVANLLCGYDVDTWFDEPVELSPTQLIGCDKLLQAVIHNWPALKNMPVDNFRQLFLQRSAQVYENQDGWCIEIEPKTIDVLLTKMPWGLGYLSLPWLGKALIQVKWQYGF